MKPIVDYEIVDHGIVNSQYFQGCGTVFTQYKHCATGIGDDFREAVDDCLEQLAMKDYETEGMEERISRDYLDGKPLGEYRSESVYEYLEAEGLEEDIDCELWYYVSIMVK